MALRTPGMEKQHAALAALTSRYIDVDTLPWKPTPYKGVDIKILMEDPETGIMTSLTRFAPGAELPMHEHVELEQSWVLEGRLIDHEGEVHAGQYVWRPKGSKHVARAPEGCLVLGFFLKPNKFF
jgi:anti-sigma factor ChrR (cupin superfamily)